MKKTSLILSAIALIFATSCKNDTKKEEKKTETEMTSTPEEARKQQKITLTKLEGSPEFADASLKLKSPTETKQSKKDIEFNFEVENYELGAQTEPEQPNMLASSAKGQHIHFILDNEPYSAHYESKFSKTLDQGDHVMIAFLSRSYHEAVKNENSFVVKKFSVGEPSEDQMMEVDFEAPHMFYSRPKGTYKGEDTQKVMLDFFLVNTDLATDANQVRATINGQEFMLDDWVPYVMGGLPMGENTVELELLDADGNLIDGPYNKTTRTFMLEK
ncbi:MAG: hypothetical protein ACTIJT_08070 [Mesonia sp.]|uniref:hypothetical protein n=1 Tax=Mesonia sp. TaxID=1960830 RepID=UPI003F9C9571